MGVLYSSVVDMSGACIRYWSLRAKLVSGLCRAWKGLDHLEALPLGLGEVEGSPFLLCGRTTASGTRS